jgi:hypothetical protein
MPRHLVAFRLGVAARRQRRLREGWATLSTAPNCGTCTSARSRRWHPLYSHRQPPRRNLPTLDLVISTMLGCFILALWLMRRGERGYARRVRPHVVHLITVRAGDGGAIGLYDLVLRIGVPLWRTAIRARGTDTVAPGWPGRRSGGAHRARKVARRALACPPALRTHPERVPHAVAHACFTSYLPAKLPCAPWASVSEMSMKKSLA